jgi:O-antigen ligase
MPEHIRALVVILVMAAGVFALAKAPVCALACREADFKRRRNMWFAVTVVAFLSSNPWVYVVAVSAVLYYAYTREHNKLALYFFLIATLPPFDVKVPGFSAGSMLLEVQYYRMTATCLLLPAFLAFKPEPAERFGRLLMDKLLVAYMVLIFWLVLEATNFTIALRLGVIYNITDIFLPYYVASRCLRRMEDVRDAAMSLIVPLLVLALIGLFEFSRHWLLYSSLPNFLGVEWDLQHYLARGTSLRAVGTMGQAIPLGYAMAVAIGLFLYAGKLIPNRTWRVLTVLLLLGGLIASLSRGPWIGVLLMYVVFTAAGREPVKKLSRVVVGALIVMPLLLVSPLGDTVVSYLPFVGSVQGGDTADFRAQLLTSSIDVFKRNPFFGSFDYLRAPELQSLRTGAGLIDVVNTYVGIALAYGAVGLVLFVGFFVVAGFRIFKAMRSIQNPDDERHVLGQALFATLVGILFIIFTCSSISIIPVLYWPIAGLGIAYARLAALPLVGGVARKADPARPPYSGHLQPGRI